jgi:hypothetical protein
MRDRVAMKDGIVVLERIVAVMIAEWPFGSALVRRRLTNQGEFRLCHQTMRFAERILRHAQFFTAKQ